MRVVVAGTGRLGAAILEPLLESSHEVAGLVLNGQRTRGVWRRYQATSPLLGLLDAPVRIARQSAIPMVWLDQMELSHVDAVANLKPDLLITCGFGIILKKPLLSIPTIGCVNVHSSLLPKHRGPMPFNWVVLQGDTETGVTFHVTTSRIDGGDIIDQQSLPVGEHDTAMTVYRRCCDLARQRVSAVVDSIAENGLRGTQQDETESTYDPPLRLDDLRIDWRWDAREIHRLVRAGTPYLPAHFKAGRRRVGIERASHHPRHVDACPGCIVQNDPYVTVATGAGTLQIQQAASMTSLGLPWPNAFNTPRIGTILQ